MQDSDASTRASEPRAQIIAVGSELLTPEKIDTNSLFLTRHLNQLGIRVERKLVVGDSSEQISQGVQQALQSAQVVIVTGGLGPTTDDITREVVAEVLNRPLHFDDDLMEKIEKRVSRFGFKLSENNRRQAKVPEGATVLENSRGTAPGLYIKTGDCSLFLLPGPPAELKPMFRKQVLDRIRGQVPDGQFLSEHLRVASLGESAVDARIAPIYQGYEEINTTILSSPGIVDLHFSCRQNPSSEGEVCRLGELVRNVRRELKEAVFADKNQSLASVLGDLLMENGLIVATAESCTGGLLAKTLTDVPGSSKFFSGAIVAYSNDIKTSVLSVSPENLSRWGAVSAPIAEEMAFKVCALMKSTVSIALTGIAGPDGFSKGKPLGLVFSAISINGKVKVKKKVFPGDRQAVRLRSARFAMDWLRREIL